MTTPDKSITIGILGGGQLARMSAQAAQRLGFQVVVLDTDPFCPAAQVTPWLVAGDYKDEDCLRQLARMCRYVTLENEWVEPNYLDTLKELGAEVVPGSSTIEVIQDKFFQRSYFNSVGLPSPKATTVARIEDGKEIAQTWGYPLVLKARYGGYDGHGVRFIQDESRWSEVMPDNYGQDWYLEEYVPVQRELAVMAAIDRNKEIVVYPVVESKQTKDGHRCDWVRTPASSLSAATLEEIDEIVHDFLEGMFTVGLFGLEFFLTDEDEVMINEVAPRPHNSGHYSMDFCVTSQFEQHIRAVTGIGLGPTGMRTKAAAMANLLAPTDDRVDIQAALKRTFDSCPGSYVHWYGKSTMRTGRKMGHINVSAQTPDKALTRALEARRAFWNLGKGSQET